MSKRTLLMVGSVLLMGGPFVIRAQDGAATGDKPPSGNAEARLKLANSGLEMASKLVVSGHADFEAVKTWSLRVMDAERESGGNAVEAVQDHLNRMKGQLEIALAQKEAARGTELPVADARYAILEAEELLARTSQ